MIYTWECYVFQTESEETQIPIEEEHGGGKVINIRYLDHIYLIGTINLNIVSYFLFLALIIIITESAKMRNCLKCNTFANDNVNLM